MATVPELSTISLESLDSDQQEVVTPIAEAFNLFNEQTHTALNRNLTFTENFRADVRTLQLTSTSTPTVAISIRKPVGVFVISCRNITTPSATLSAAPYLDWRWDGAGNIDIRKVIGLTGSDTHEVTFIVLAG